MRKYELIRFCTYIVWFDLVYSIMYIEKSDTWALKGEKYGLVKYGLPNLTINSIT